MARHAPKLVLSDDERHAPRRCAQAASAPQALAFRARLVLRCAAPDDPPNGRDFCRHLAGVADLYAGAKRVHRVMDNLNTHWSLDLCRLFARLSGVRCPLKKLERGRDRKAFLTDPGHRHVVYFTPTHGSWLNQIEIWFGVLARRVLRRGEFRSREELAREVLDFIDHYNAHLAHPYRWTFTGKPLTA